MATSFDTYYINAENFSDATSIFTDAAMTTVAPDGTYQFNGVHRTMSSGVLGSPFFCGTCCAGCSGTYIYPIPASKNREYTVCSNVGSSTRTAIVVSFKFTGSAPKGFPLGLSATYDSTFYKGVSSNRFGYLPELYVGNNNVVLPSVLEGTYDLDGFAWQPLTSSFVDAADTTRAIAQADYNVTLGNPDQCYLLVPKMSVTETVDVQVYSPTPTDPTNNPILSNGGCDITIPCPTALEYFAVSDTQASRADACSASRDNTAYLMRVNSTSGSPRMFDRAFSDSAGVTPLAEGYYQISGLVGTLSGSAWIHVVGTNGEIQSVGSCSQGLPLPQPELVELICSERRNDQTQACLYQNQQGERLPDQQYWFDGSGDEPVAGVDTAYSDAQGITPLANGWYQMLRAYKVFEVTGGSGLITTITNC